MKYLEVEFPDGVEDDRDLTSDGARAKLIQSLQARSRPSTAGTRA